MVYFFLYLRFLIYSLILVYHWLKYGIGSFTVWFAMIAYFSVSLICIILMYLSAIIIFSMSIFTLSKDEKIIAVIRKHWFILLRDSFGLIVIYIVPFIAYWYFFDNTITPKY